MTERVALGKVCDFLYGDGLREDKRRGGYVPVYGSNGIVGWHEEAITNGPTIVIGRKGSIGEIHYSAVPCWPIDTTYYIHETKKPCDLKWLYYTLLSLGLTDLNKSAAIPGLNRNDAYEKEIPLPPLPEQEHIAAILDKADSLRRLRRFSLELGESYLQSVFLEMFGDPVTNPMGWEKINFEDVCEEIYRYPTFYGFKYLTTGTPVARIGNILANGVLDPDLTNYVFIDDDLSIEFPRTILEIYDILMAVRGDGSTATRIGLVTSPNLVGANISPNLLRFKSKWNVMHPFYLYHLMVSDGGQKLIGRWVTRTAKKTITARDIKKIELPTPPYKFQERFVTVVRQYERLHVQQQESLRQSEHLFRSLLDRVFGGEL